MMDEKVIKNSMFKTNASQKMLDPSSYMTLRGLFFLQKLPENQLLGPLKDITRKDGHKLQRPTGKGPWQKAERKSPPTFMSTRFKK